MGDDQTKQSPIKDFNKSGGNEDYQSNQLLNLVHHMQQPVTHIANLNQIRSPEILNQMRQKIIFSDRLKNSTTEVQGEIDMAEEDVEDDDQLSSAELNCTQTDPNQTQGNVGDASLKTKDQKEMQAIIATTKQFTCGNTGVNTTVDDYISSISPTNAGIPTIVTGKAQQQSGLNRL